MEFSYMLNQMCHEALSNADINAIRKARGFTKRETESRSQFESFFLSSIGLETAMRELAPAEIACLHLLNRKNEEVSVAFFARLYGSRERYHDTFTQQYQDTFRDVKQNMLRRGLLLMAELRTRSDNTKMERWRFRFPPEFAPYLPPLIPEPCQFDAPGDDRSEKAQREKVLEALDTSTVKHLRQTKFTSIVTGGDFTVGKQPVSVKRLTEWQEAAWAHGLGVTMPNDDGQSLHPVEAVRILLESLAPGEWALLNLLTDAFDIFCFGVKTPLLKEICQAGWKKGSLVLYTENKKIYYRLPSIQALDAEPVAPKDYLKPTPEGDAVIVDLHNIPFDDLETLNCLARLDVENGQLVATPNEVKLGRTVPEKRESALGVWLATQIPGFGKVFETIAENWGKTILHSNLLIACVKDLSLRIQLERGLGNDLILLSKEFVAFPAQARQTAEKIVAKGGFVVKTVQADE